MQSGMDSLSLLEVTRQIERDELLKESERRDLLQIIFPGPCPWCGSQDRLHHPAVDCTGLEWDGRAKR